LTVDLVSHIDFLLGVGIDYFNGVPGPPCQSVTWLRRWWRWLGVDIGCSRMLIHGGLGLGSRGWRRS